MAAVTRKTSFVFTIATAGWISITALGRADPGEASAVGGQTRHGDPDPSKTSTADRAQARNDDATWVAKHKELVEKARAGGIDLYFEGDSITRRWEATHKENWDKNFAGWKAADFGAGGDQTQNVLYRIENGELDGVNPKAIVLLIGTNNVGADPPPRDDDALADDVAHGVEACVAALRKKAPNAKILLIGITARNDKGRASVMPTINKINASLARLADGKTLTFLNINDNLAGPEGKLYEGMTEDGLHLSNKGYQAWADAMRPILTEWLGPPSPLGH